MTNTIKYKAHPHNGINTQSVYEVLVNGTKVAEIRGIVGGWYVYLSDESIPTKLYRVKNTWSKLADVKKWIAEQN